MLDFHYHSLIFNSCNFYEWGTTLYGSLAMLLPAVIVYLHKVASEATP